MRSSTYSWSSSDPVAISFNQLQSVAISGNQLQSVAISCNQLQSVAISCNQWQSVAICGNLWQSVAINVLLGFKCRPILQYKADETLDAARHLDQHLGLGAPCLCHALEGRPRALAYFDFRRSEQLDELCRHLMRVAIIRSSEASTRATRGYPTQSR